MEIYYVINNKKYIDSFLLKEKLEINKSELQYIMKTYPFPEKEIFKHQNKILYSLKEMNAYIEMLVKENER